jgi:hypothetical protein
MVRVKLNEKANSWYKDLKWQLHKFVNYGPIAKFICACIIWTVVAVPMSIYFLFRWIFEPVTFWENLALFVAWVFLFGWVQAIFLLFGIILTLKLLLEDW